jgi:hypothetical protein
MASKLHNLLKILPVALALAMVAGWAGPISAHCDTLGGPVVQDARIALQKGDVTPVLKWVKPEYETQIRKAFQETLVVRAKGPEAMDLADRYFFETLVRIHRAGEGAPYTGLKPADAVEPIIAMSDKALESSSVDSLLKAVTEDVAKGIRERFQHVLEAKKNANESVEAGREFVAAYVIYTHYVERLHADATTNPSHHGEEGAEAAEAHHQ